MEIEVQRKGLGNEKQAWYGTGKRTYPSCLPREAMLHRIECDLCMGKLTEYYSAKQLHLQLISSEVRPYIAENTVTVYAYSYSSAQTHYNNM